MRRAALKGFCYPEFRLFSYHSEIDWVSLGFLPLFCGVKIVKYLYLIFFSFSLTNAAFNHSFFLGFAHANQVKIVKATFSQSKADVWAVNVTLKHHDTSWKHYADIWRIVDGTGKILAERVLRHPHKNEQPFTRGLSQVQIPPGTKLVYIEAHDKIHGWSKKRLKIDLQQIKNGKLSVQAK